LIELLAAEEKKGRLPTRLCERGGEGANSADFDLGVGKGGILVYIIRISPHHPGHAELIESPTKKNLLGVSEGGAKGLNEAKYPFMGRESSATASWEIISELAFITAASPGERRNGEQLKETNSRLNSEGWNSELGWKTETLGPLTPERVGGSA